jgi:hypothetical protein
MNTLSNLICLDGSYIACWFLYFYSKRTSIEFILHKSKGLYNQNTFDRYIFYFGIHLILNVLLITVNYVFNCQFPNLIVNVLLGLLTFPKILNYITKCIPQIQNTFRIIKLIRIRLVDEVLKKSFGYFLSDLLYSNHSYFRFTRSYSESLAQLKHTDHTKIGLFLCNCVCIFVLYRFRNSDNPKYYMYYKVIKYIYWTFSNYKYEHESDKQFLKEYIIEVIDNNWEQIDSPIFAHAIVDIMESKNWVQQHSKKLEFHITIYMCLWSISYWFDNSFLSYIFVVVRDKKTKQFKFKESFFKLNLIVLSYTFGIHYLITNFFLLNGKMSFFKDLCLLVFTQFKQQVHLSKKKK